MVAMNGGWVTVGHGGDNPADPQEAWRSRQRPDNELPAAVGLDVVLVRTDEVAVFISSLRAYRTGVDFTLEIRVRNADVEGHAHDLLASLYGDHGGDNLLFGVEFSDGRSCALPGHGHHQRDAGDEDTAPQLWTGGGSGGTRSADMDLFLSPLPPAGELRFVCAWPCRGIPETTTVIPAEQIQHAATHAKELWPWEPEPEPSATRRSPAVPEGGWFAAHLDHDPNPTQ